MTTYREAWQGLLEDLERRHQWARSMGGDERIERQHARGRLTARERIDRLADPDSFAEIGALAGGEHPGGQPPLAADALVGGTCRVHGRPVVVMAEDFTVKGGSIGHPNAAKRARLIRLCAEQSLPLVIMLDGAGERASHGGERYPVAPGDLQLAADLKGLVPVVTLVMGTSAGHGALTGMFADLIVMVEGSSLFTAGPPLVEASLGISATPEELGGARMHTRDSGVAHNLAATEDEAVAMARYFLSMLPAHRDDLSSRLDLRSDAAPRRVDALLDIIPAASQQSYDMRQVLAELVDRDSLFQLQPDFGASLIIALARFAGIPCLIMANQPAVMAGAITSHAARKAAHFIDMAAAFGLPLISLIDNPGVLPGPDSERAGVLREAGAMFAAQRRYRGCKVVATLRKAFGFGSSVMGMNPWDRQLVSLALPSVNLGGMPAIGGAEAARASAEEAEHMQHLQSGAWVPADAMAFDKVIEPAELRNEILAALELSAQGSRP